jgi:hypothetical protein
MEDPTVMTRQPAVPRQRPDQGRVRSAVRQWPQWVCYATACWSLLYGLLGSFWALGGAGFPFGGAHDDTVLATSRAATAGPVIAAVCLAGGVLALVMAKAVGADPPAAWTTPANVRRWGAWAVAVAVAVPTFYALTRWAWALGIPLGFSRQALRAEAAQSPGIWLAGAGLATLAVGGALLTLGLTQRWGEVYPRWVPFPRGKPVRPRTAIIPATVVAILVTSAGMAYLRAMLTGQVSLDWGAGPTLLWPVWGAALGAATLAYHLRRRGHCRHCHRS